MSALIRLENVTRVYQTEANDVPALRSVSLEIRSGEFVALMGASGSGKSTLMNILGCLDRPTSGRYLFEGEDVSELGQKELADIRNQKLGFVFQNFNLFPRTSALENVELPLLYQHHLRRTAREQREMAMRALERIGLADRAHHHSNQLSGGQQQRVAIARALVNEPQLLLADEPTGNLDSRTSLEVMGVFQALNRRGITIVLVTHESDIARHAGRNVVLRDGRIISDRPVAAPFAAETGLRSEETSENATTPSS